VKICRCMGACFPPLFMEMSFAGICVMESGALAESFSYAKQASLAGVGVTVHTNFEMVS
jgi:hypothetical protein